jgi:hypothetical protein
VITPNPLPNIVIVVVNQHSAQSAHATSTSNDKNTETNEASQLDQGSIVMFGNKSQTNVQHNSHVPDDVKQNSVTRHKKTMESDSYSGDDTNGIVDTDSVNNQVTSNTDDNNDEIKPIGYIIDTCLNKQLPVFSWDNYPYFPGAFNSSLMDFCITVPSQEEFVSENRVSKKITFGWAETLVGRTHRKR